MHQTNFHNRVNTTLDEPKTQPETCRLTLRQTQCQSCSFSYHTQGNKNTDSARQSIRKRSRECQNSAAHDSNRNIRPLCPNHDREIEHAAVLSIPLVKRKNRLNSDLILFRLLFPVLFLSLPKDDLRKLVKMV